MTTKWETELNEKYSLTEEESAKIIATYFPDGPEGLLTELPSKEKRKIAILRHVIKRFDTEKQYKEIEVNRILKTVNADISTLRRSLIVYDFMDRHDDGSLYWVKKHE